MAKVERRTLGDYKGKIGGVVFRIFRQNNFMALAPYKYTKPDTKEYRDKTQRFKTAVLFATAASQLRALRLIWKREFPERRVYNLYISINHAHSLPDDIKETAVISPQHAIKVVLDETVLTGEMIIVKLQPFKKQSSIDTSVEKFIKLESVLVLTKPSKTNEPVIRMFALESELREFNLTDPVELPLSISYAHVDYIHQYGAAKIFCSLVTFDANKQPLNSSGTFCAVL